MKRPVINILTYILDDQEELIEAIDIYFKEKAILNYRLFTHPKEFLEHLTEDVAVCIIDYRLANIMSGADVIKEVKKRNPLCYFIVMSAELNVERAVECVNNGANKILLKSDDNFLNTLIDYLKEAIDIVTERFDTYSTIWERYMETEKLFKQLKSNNDRSKLDTANNND